MHPQRLYSTAPYAQHRLRDFAAVVAVTTLVLTASLVAIGASASSQANREPASPPAPFTAGSARAIGPTGHAVPAVQHPYGVGVISAGATYAGFLPWFGSGPVGPCQDPSSGTSPATPAVVSSSISGLCLNGVGLGDISSTWDANLTNATSYANGSAPVAGCPPLSSNLSSYPGCVFFGSNEFTAFVSNWSSGAPLNSSVIWHPNETGWLPSDMVFQVDVGFNVSAPLGTTYSLTIDLPGATPVPQTFYVRSPLVMGGGSVDIAFDMSLAWTTLIPWNNTVRVGVLPTVDNYALNVSLVSPCSVCYNVTFLESGLPPGTLWWANFTGGPSLGVTGNSTSIELPDGFYYYELRTSNHLFAGAGSGGFLIAGFNLTQYADFYPFKRAANFNETGLPPGSEWTVNIATGPSASTNTSSLSIFLQNGTYAYTPVSNVSGWWAASGTFTINGGNISILVVFVPLNCTSCAIFYEAGLPAGATWEVTLVSGNSSSTTTILSNATVIVFEAPFEVPNGTYSYTIPNLWYTPSPASGTITINGTMTAVAVTFSALATVPLIFHETGLPLGTLWGLSLGIPSRSVSSNLSRIPLSVPVGRVSFNITSPPGFGVERVRGPLAPGQTFANVTGRTVLTVVFGHLESLSFNPVGLVAPNSPWGIAIRSAFPSGGAPPQAKTGQLLSGVGMNPQAIAFDGAKQQLFVADHGSGAVSVYSAPTGRFLTSIPVGSTPSGMGTTYDSGRGEVFVDNYFDSTVSVVNDSFDAVSATIPGFGGPAGSAYDPFTGQVFVANYDTDNVSVISDATNTIVRTIAVGINPAGVAFDPIQREIFVTNNGSSNVSVIDDASGSVVATLATGSGPHGIGFDVRTDQLFVSSSGTGTVDVFNASTNTLTTTIPVGGTPWGPIAYDPARGEMFVANTNSTPGLSVINDSLDAVVASVGLPSGLHGTAFDPVHGIVFVTNSLSNNVSGISDSNYSARETFASLICQPGSAPITFTVVQGPWKFTVTPKPNTTTARPSHGTVLVPAHNVTRQIVFRNVTEKIVFREHGLPLGTGWGVYYSGPGGSTIVLTTAPSLRLLLVNGTYTFSTVLPGHSTATPLNGSFTVVAPSLPRVFYLNYTFVP